MPKKYIALFVATVFLLGVSSFGLCLDTKPHSLPKCCFDKSSSTTSDSENCFSHCAKQKLNAVKIETHLKEDLKIKTHILLDNKSSGSPQSQLFNSSPFTKYYLIQIATKLNISQIYFLAIFNHAPPLPLN